MLLGLCVPPRQCKSFAVHTLFRFGRAMQIFSGVRKSSGNLHLLTVDESYTQPGSNLLPSSCGGDVWNNASASREIHELTVTGFQDVWNLSCSENVKEYTCSLRALSEATTEPRIFTTPRAAGGANLSPEGVLFFSRTSTGR